jgi:transcriptional regulator with XRE-family HTH domain
MVTLGAKIKKLREIRGYSQSFMAVKLGISQSQYSYLETRQKNIADTTIKTISVLLGVTPAYLKDFDLNQVIQSEKSPRKLTMQDFKTNNNNSEREAYLDLIARLKKEIAELKARKK